MKQIQRTITKDKIRDLIKAAGPTFFSIKFHKKNGDLRTLNGRMNVKSKLHGGKSTTAHLTDYITVYDVHALGYRNVNIDKTVEVKVLGRTYKVI